MSEKRRVVAQGDALGNNGSLVRWNVLSWLFYGGLILLLLTIVTGLLPRIAPPAIATRLAYNSEGYLFAVALGSWIQFILPIIHGRSRVFWALTYGAFWGALGFGLLASGLPSRLVTLNESAFALAILIPYVSIRRPLPRWVFGVVPVMVLLTIWAVGWARQSWVIDQAETFGLVVLAILTFDVFDRGLLSPDAVVGRRVRWVWYGVMVLEPVLVSGLGTEVRADESVLGLTLEYLGRIHESFFGVLLVVGALYIARAGRHLRESSGSAT